MITLFLQCLCRLLDGSVVHLLCMLFKILHSIVLLCYLNILAYQPEVAGASRHDDTLLNGESLLEIVLDDVLDIPIDEHADDVQIPYDEYRPMEQMELALAAFIFVLAVLFSFELFATYLKHPVYSGKKRFIIPAYYTHLYRFQPF